MFKKHLLSAGLGALMILNAQALSITPATTALVTGDHPSQNQINSFLADFFDLDVDAWKATCLYTQNVEGAEEGSLADNYTTEFSNSATDPADATITHNGGASFDSPAYLLVKDGNGSPSWYLFDLSDLNWNGTETLELTGFWPNQGGISHISIYQGVGVPDGGATVALLGASLLGLGFLRRKLAR